jgi:hypothetical protein
MTVPEMRMIMARTRKDRPWWVTNADPKTRVGEDHNCERTGQVCDIGDKHVAGKYQTCFYFTADEFDRSRYAVQAPKKSECRTGYWAPERASVRQVLTRFKKETGVVDDSQAPVEQHRHASHGHWWWD